MCFLLQTTNPLHIKMDGCSPLESTTFLLKADGEEIASTDNFIKAVALWIAAFYVFNLDYPTCVSKSLAFIQRIILNINDNMPVSRAIITLTNKLNSV